MLGPFVDHPFHATLGDRDIGECSDLDTNKVNWISRKSPGLDRFGCGAYDEIGPVLLLYERYTGIGAFERSSSSFIERLNVVPKNRERVGAAGLYNLLHTLPLNASYILQALRPRM
ncbi:hypothetical protein MTR_8g020410 [Medicago truncatula]|uniref:Uncharacterized protein n=1 Tax=Medicago truncatula TaxID=3880 RepID=G7L6T2_MEDTR|nr:hypothetical protein MTR_8g020410 [Medicago truncatula]